MSYLNQQDYKRNAKEGLKVIGGKNTVIHCHHYNSRLQRTIEGNDRVDGRFILRSSAALVYFDMLTNLKKVKNSGVDLTLAEELYSFLGFGKIQIDLNERKVFATESHFVEGWRCGSVKTKGKVCRVTEGYLEGAIKAITGKNVSIRELKCMNEGHKCCEFEICEEEKEVYDFNMERFTDFSFKENVIEQELDSNIDKDLIVNTVIEMPLEGNNEGLIPAFNVYLAHTPQDFYNLISINFVKEMYKHNIGEVAEEMLVEDAENCALNTFGGILDSEEWRGLVEPMLKDSRDKIFGLVAVANALGWGRINITEHTPFKSLELVSGNGYEAFGYIEYCEYSNAPQCFMLKGVAIGLMELVYETGDLEDRAGKYIGSENCCLTKKDKICKFVVKVDE